MEVDSGCGAAMRTRQRRLRQWLRRERLSVAGPCRVNSPRSPTGTQEGKGLGGREYETQYTAKFRKHSSSKRPAQSTLRSTTTTVCRSSGAPGLTASTRERGSAAPRGPDRRHCACAADSCRPCAADGRTAGGRPPFLRHAVSCCRAGYGRAQDHPRGHPCAEPQLVEQLVDEPVPSFDDFDLVEEGHERFLRGARGEPLSR